MPHTSTVVLYEVFFYDTYCVPFPKKQKTKKTNKKSTNAVHDAPPDAIVHSQIPSKTGIDPNYQYGPSWP